MEPQDWVVESDIAASHCELCAKLRAFCEDPIARVERFPIRQELRRHLHDVIDQNGLDMFHVTERRGRPYTLVCTKNRASHERRLAEYAEDVAWMRSLAESEPGGRSVIASAPSPPVCNVQFWRPTMHPEVRGRLGPHSA